MTHLRVLIVSENISMEMGGESSLPFYYAKHFSDAGVEVWLACHERVSRELAGSFPELAGRIRVVRDTPVQKLVHTWGRSVPYRVRDLVLEQAIHMSSQLRIRAIARDLARRGRIDVVFEPAPITPKGLSFMYGLGVPVVIGPLGGGMQFPPAFRDLDSRLSRATVDLARRVSDVAHRVVAGKREADVLLVANDATRRALPSGCRGRIIQLFESGVDLELWSPCAEPAGAGRGGDVRFIFSGRFVDWKGIQYLVPAFERALAEEPRCRLDLVGAGELDATIDAMLDCPALRARTTRHGWLSRRAAAELLRGADVFVMPSLRECGGTAILEAMAMGKPIIAARWGGPADYVAPECGILVEPISKEAFVAGLADAMVRLARSPELRLAMGRAGVRRVREDYLDWGSKAARVLEILREVVETRSARARRVRHRISQKRRVARDRSPAASGRS